ncbi:alkaline phosphatase PhoX [Micrococcus sp.]|uniref:alkaline phosphatase PhoX n=1 Tax=Micrococcus sp. TaxID=1271 RepID=UPI002A91578E|nr:alkaline phosphatase PhoX [Micrococcus sp.]MDY6055451.1 DUF839 domain-containing protein [Micrococcus sp.]
MPRGFKAVRISTIGVEPVLSDRGGRVIGTTVVEVSRNGALRQQWVSLSGTIRNCAGGPTPWNTWLTCEEDTSRAGDWVTSSVDGGWYALQQDHGYVFEVFPAEAGCQVPRPIRAWGRGVFEAAAIGPDLASAYITEDTRGGLFYRWTAPAGVTLGPGIADRLGPEDGVLQAAQLVRDGVPLEHYSQLTAADLGAAYPVRWVDGGQDRQAEFRDLRRQFPGATQHRKIEGVWQDAAGEGLWFTLSFTNEGEHPAAIPNQGIIVYYSFGDQTMTVKDYWGPGHEFDAPDNITVSPWGGVVIAEDGSDPNHLVAFTERRGAQAIARDLTARGEWAGPCFGNGNALFANVQSDCTYMITGPLARYLSR